MKKIKKAVVLIYVLFLVTISLTFATILLSNNDYLFNITGYFNIEGKLAENIRNDGKIASDLNKSYNLNGSGFVDNISCPPIGAVTMSGNTVIGTLGTELTFSGTQVYCEGIYNSDPVKINFNNDFSDFLSAEYLSSAVTLTLGVGDSVFLDPDSTLIDFSGFNYNIGDDIDDNFNSDNYKVTSTGTTATGTYYALGKQDDDVLGRKTIFGFIKPDMDFKKVFWNSPKVLRIIDENTNNNDSLNIKLGEVGSGILYFELDQANTEIKLYEFDKSIFENTKELILLDSLKGTFSTQTGYLQNDVSLSETITTSEYNFDFINKMYAIFLKADPSGILSYKIKGGTDTGTGIYLTPIDDSQGDIIKYAGNEILIDDSGRFIYRESEIIYKK